MTSAYTFPMTASRCVGLLGGVGVGAASYYYRELAKVCTSKGVDLDLVMVNAETPKVLAFAQAGDSSGMAGYANSFIERMKLAGAEFAVIPSVTGSFGARELASISPLPVLDLFTVVTEEIARRAIKRVAVFGTRFVIESNMFDSVPGVQFIKPQADEIDTIHSNYVQMAMDSRGTEEQYITLRELALRLCEREGLDAIVLGGTDLSLIFNESNTDFPHVDCAAVHLRAIAARMLV